MRWGRRMGRDPRRLRASGAVVTVVAAVVGLTTGAAAHKPITSPFTFYEDVLPITSGRCGACHAPEGAAPMSLLSHEAAVPWAESMRLELVAGHMPPGSDVSPRGRFQHTASLTARELNVLLTWATGGTPSGDPAKANTSPVPVPVRVAGWPLGRPAEVVPLPPVALESDETSRVVETILPLGPRPRALAAVDFRPGTPAIVRSARILVREHDGGSRRETVIGLWVPGDEAARLPARAAWSVAAGADLVVRTVYRKRWDREREAASDQSVIALYERDGPPGAAAAGLDVLATTTDTTGRRMVATTRVAQPRRVLALWPDTALAGASVRVTLIQPGGVRSLLAAFDARAGWERRFRLIAPEHLAAGAQVEVAATWASPPAAAESGGRLLGLDVVGDE